MPTASTRCSLSQIQKAFLAALPRIEAHGDVYFRHAKCPGKKEDCLAEMRAISWQW